MGSLGKYGWVCQASITLLLAFSFGKSQTSKMEGENKGTFWPGREYELRIIWILISGILVKIGRCSNDTTI